MSKSSVKPKATLIWNEQIEKLKKKLVSLADTNLYFEQGKMDEVFNRLQDKVGNSNRELYEIKF
ncbi:MAG: hypothetical protein ACM3NR_00510 [Methanosarcina sp.]